MKASSCSAFTTAGIDRLDFADLADVEVLARIVAIRHQHLARVDQAAVLAGQTDRLAAEVVDQRDDVLLHFAAEHPFDDFHRLFVGDAHALNEGALLADFLQRLVDLRTAAVHDDRIDADQFQQDHVAREALLEALFGHGVAAVFDDHGLTVILANVRQRLGQDFSLQGGRDLRKVREARTWRQAQARNS